MTVTNYLDRSGVRGIYRYRRAISPDLVGIWGQREVKKSLKTSNHPEALRRAVEVNNYASNSNQKSTATAEPIELSWKLLKTF